MDRQPSSCARMMAMLVVQAQQVLAVVVAVGCAQDDMNMIFVRLGAFAKSDAALVIELDDDHWTLDAIVKDAVVRATAHPAKIRVIQMALDFVHLDLGMTVAHATDVIFHQAEQ